ncbi:MAG: T9SS type A sorting domain-containing protein [Sphingobacteriaceae bacterium]|nr:MAG: T9SS type A sorting domain-containing protein [Sphingobacteriaceae bacterium]
MIRWSHSLFILLFTFISFNLFAEGSKQLMPDINSRAALCTQGSSGFAGYASLPKDRLFIHIKDAANEIVYLNFSLGYGTGVSNILGEGNGDPYYFRIKDPLGNVVYGPQLINTSPIPSGVTGYNQIMAGPSALAAGGYNAYSFTPSSGNGDYYIEFNKTDPNTATSSQCSFDYWDITVANTTSGVVDGRVWAYSWGLYSKDYTTAGYSGVFKGKLFTYSTDQVVQSVDFSNSGFKGGSFRIGFSTQGPGTSGNYLLDRQSKYNIRSVGNDHKVFLNDPDITVYPSGSILANAITISSTPFNCNSTSVTFNYNLTQGGIVEVLLDFNNNGVFDYNTRDRILAQTLAAGAQSVVWDLKDGLGNTVTPDTDPVIKLITTYGKSVSHLTLADVEYFSGGFIPTVVRPAQPSPYAPKLYYDDEAMRTAIAATATPNRQYPDTLLAFNVASQPIAKELNGCVAPCHTWTNFGTAAGGDYQNNNNLGFGNGNSVNTWWYSYVENKEYTFLMASCSVLPLTLTKWKATAQPGYTVQLSWNAANAVNHEMFEIQRSFDMVHFETIANVRDAVNFSGSAFLYTDTDNKLQGKTFAAYKLVQVDKDGKKNNSDVQVARFSKDAGSKLAITSNPVKDKAQISFYTQLTGLATAKISDMSGKIISSRNFGIINGNNILNYDGLNKLSGGMYILTLTTNNTLIGQQKFIKE